jgi:hypothetical protein
VTLPESTRLCESCGYVVEGLPLGTVCPECATLVPTSRDARRPGTPWQQRRNLAHWVVTSLLMFVAPRAASSAMRIDRGTSESLLICNLSLATTLNTCAVAHALAKKPGRFEVFGLADVVAYALAAAIMWIVLFWMVSILTVVEQRGIRFFGKSRSWRITRNVALVVVAHAAVGWVIGGCLMLAASLLTTTRYVVIGREYVSTGWILAAGFFLGLLVFETLVFLGVRQCRFANLPDPPAASTSMPPDPRAP